MSILIKNGYCIDGFKEGYFDLLIEGNRIKKIGKFEENADSVMDAKNCLVMPAFCNAHTHLAMSLFRGMADDLELMEWLEKHIFPAEARYVNPEMVYKCSKLSMLEAIRGGTSCFFDMYFFEEEVSKAALDVGMRGVIGEGIADFKTPSCVSPEKAVEKTRLLKDEFDTSSLIKVSYAPHSTYTLSLGTLKLVADSLDEDDIVHIHINESKREIELVKSQKGKKPIEVLREVGLLGEHTYMAHCVETDDDDIELIKKAQAKVINVPQSNLKLASGIAPVQKMLDRGIEVFIGTDGSASNNNLDIIEEVRTVSLVQKVKFNEKALNAKDAFRMLVNFNGLFDAGRLEVGKLADIVIVKLDGFEAIPIYNPYSFVIYALNSRDVRDVIINGKVILKNGEFVNMDEEKVKFEVRELAKGLGGL